MAQHDDPSSAGDRQAEMLANRVRKRARHLRKWARRENVGCYRLYDRDIPEIPLAIDWYDGRLYIALYHKTPKGTPTGAQKDKRTDSGPSRPPALDNAWCAAMASAVARALDVPESDVHIKQRRRQRGASQYNRLGETGEETEVTESGHRFLVNLHDYLDTGLFLDHRTLRSRVEREASGRRFLNLFCYTGAFTVYAAAGGARATVSVDLSARYLAWAERNMACNGFTGPEHQYVRDEVIELLRRGPGPRQAAAFDQPFDLVVLDPPTFSNSKKMHGVLDVRRDHPMLIAGALDLMAPGGVLYFSTNARGFRLDDDVRAAEVEDITDQTLSPDFERKPPHRCFRLVK